MKHGPGLHQDNFRKDVCGLTTKTICTTFKFFGPPCLHCKRTRLFPGKPFPFSGRDIVGEGKSWSFESRCLECGHCFRCHWVKYPDSETAQKSRDFMEYLRRKKRKQESDELKEIQRGLFGSATKEMKR